MIKKNSQRTSAVVLDERSLAATAGGTYFDDWCGTPWPRGPLGPILNGPILNGPIVLPPINLPVIVIGS